MQYDVSDEEVRKSKVPHEIFLTNLIGNHVLWFIAALGIAGDYWQPIALVPVISFLILGYTLWRARRSRRIDPWFVMCHWQICVSRSKLFLSMLCMLVAVSVLGWIGYTHYGMRDVAVKAMVGGIGVLPVMATVLILIVLESDALHQAAQKKIPQGIVARFPHPAAKVLKPEAGRAGAEQA